MLKNYFRVMLRATKKSKSYTLINVLGLGLGITCAMTIFLYVYDEITFDHNHVNIDNIYRLNGSWRSTADQSSNTYPAVGYIVTEFFKKDFPEVDQMVRLRWGLLTIENGKNQEKLSEAIYQTDPNVFDVLTFPIIHGPAGNLLPDNHSMVISKKIALKYFGKTDVVGETLHTFGVDTVDYRVSGVMEDYPDNTHLKVDILVRLVEQSQVEEDWFEYGYRTFFTLKPNANIQSVESRIKFFTKPYVRDLEKEIGFIQEHSIIPLSKVHLYSHVNGENNSNSSTVYSFLIIGIFILLMACVNFTNLATARSIKRAKEIGVRKVVGAVKSQLVRQFLGEAFFTTFLAAALSTLAVSLFLPFVNSYSGKQLVILTNPIFWGLLMIIVVFVTFVSGLYPSFVLSSFKPSQTLKGIIQTHGSLQYLRKGLVIFQFVISVSLIGGTLIVFEHLKFLRNKHLGFNKDHVILLPRANENTKEQLLHVTGISNASFANKVPGMGGTGRTIVNGWNENDPLVVMDQVVVDYDYVDLYDFEIVEGRSFSRDIPSDEKEAFMINETAMSKLGYKNAKDAIGKKLLLDGDWGGKKGKVIGVLKDFHYNGVNSVIMPFSMFLHPEAKRILSVKLSSPHLQEMLEKIKNVYQTTVPDTPFEYSFLDETFDLQYQAEDRFMTIFSFLASMGIAIGCLGLYGLAMFTVEQRTKEVGIRKVLGATSNSILSLLASEFLKLVAVSFVIAIPFTYFGMETWLAEFPYREKINPLIFAVTGVALIVITMLTISYQAIRAALSNPVTSLRCD